jgi:hypothetical protein
VGSDRAPLYVPHFIQVFKSVYVGWICALPPFLTLVRVFLEVFDLVFLNSVYKSDLRAPLPPFPHLHVPWVFFDLKFWNQFSVGRDLQGSLSFSSLLQVPWGFLISGLWNQFVNALFLSLQRVPWGFDLVWNQFSVAGLRAPLPLPFTCA